MHDGDGRAGREPSHVEPLGGARRLLVYGVTGSGKTAAAERISAATGIPWTAVDDLTWEPGWVSVPGDEQRRRVTEICAADAWLLDSAYGDWLDVPLSRVEVVLALDYPRWFSLQRLVRRTFRRLRERREVCNGNTETWRQVLSSDSIVRWHFRSFARKRARIRGWEADPKGPRVLRFTRARDFERWLAALRTVEDLGTQSTVAPRSTEQVG
jgi:adenylate kinase family enzyme